jgi:hypothetical protein
MRVYVNTLVTLGLAALLVPTLAAARTIHANLEGFQEVPAYSSDASGGFRAKIDEAGGTITYELSYAGFGSMVQQAHIHIGQAGVNGGVSAFLCSNLPSPPAGTPACPTPAGTVTGIIQAADVIGPAGQGVAAGEFDELVRAIHAGVTYVNVHTETVPAGEIRGQVR